MSGKIIEFRSYDFKRADRQQGIALNVQIARILSLVGELEDLTRGSDVSSSPLLKQACSAIERTKTIVDATERYAGKGTAHDGDPQPDVDRSLLERMYRDLNPYS